MQNSELKALREELGKLRKKVQQLEEDYGQKEESPEGKKQASKPPLVIDAKGIRLQSPDGSSWLRIGGLLQVDNRTLTAPDDGSSFVLRRVRPDLRGTLWDHYEFRIMPEFGQVGTLFSGRQIALYYAYLNVHYWDEFQVRAGKFKSPLGLERLEDAEWRPFVDVGFPTELVPTRIVGIEAHGELVDKIVEWRLGAYNGAADFQVGSNIDFDTSREFAGRLLVHPLQPLQPRGLNDLALAFGFSHGTEKTANLLPSGYVTPAERIFFRYRSDAFADGDHTRFNPGGYLSAGPFFFLSEYVVSRQAVSRPSLPLAEDVQNEAWGVQGVYTLTGEPFTYKDGLTPKHPFHPWTAEGGWGAWQLVARYDELWIDPDAFQGGKLSLADPDTNGRWAKAWRVGLNWYWDQNVKVMFQFAHTDFDRDVLLGIPTGTGTANASRKTQTENAFLMRWQLRF
ncbi:OprO/OprP family phosphate-selective porin [Candidatus Methylacidithermus pantelleriae]|uniref:OprO/OprP family phosphate-selective porin n=1 Tax=Candidatus Methylacidithermus pantelleriae TaxID=2744239 RepID=UPI001BD5A71E|nr:porin [Candidatus Methylacidithermus pantelleriae]